MHRRHYTRNGIKNMINFNPYQYQSKGIEWIIQHPECALLWEMGLGKSVVTLTAIQELIDECEISRALVVAPKKVAETTWTTEAAKWSHLKGLRVVKVMGTQEGGRDHVDHRGCQVEPPTGHEGGQGHGHRETAQNGIS